MDIVIDSPHLATASDSNHYNSDEKVTLQPVPIFMTFIVFVFFSLIRHLPLSLVLCIVFCLSFYSTPLPTRAEIA